MSNHRRSAHARPFRLLPLLAILALIFPLLAACGTNPVAPSPTPGGPSSLTEETQAPSDGQAGSPTEEAPAADATSADTEAPVVTTVAPAGETAVSGRPTAAGPEPTAIGQKLDLGKLSPEIPAPTEKVQITFQSWTGQALRPFEKQFEKLYPNIDVKLQDVPAEQMQDKLTTQIAGGNAPDAAYVDNGTVGAFAPRNALVQLDPYIAKSLAVKPDDYVDAFRKAVVNKGKMYGLPFDGESTGLFYRTDLFKQAGIAGPPKTWDEFREAAQKLTNKENKQYGFIAFAPEAAYYWYPWLWQTGERAMSPDGKVTFNSERGKRAAEFYVDLARNYSPPDQLNSNSYDGRVAFANGKVAMYVAGAWFAGTMLNEFPKTKGKWASAPLPKDAQCATTIAGDSLVMFSQGKHQDATWKWIEFLSAPQNMALWNIGTRKSPGSLLPTRKSLLNDPQVFSTNPILKGFAEQMSCGVTDPAWENESWPEAEKALNENLGKAFYGDMSASEALDEAARETEDVLKR